MSECEVFMWPFARCRGVRHVAFSELPTGGGLGLVATKAFVKIKEQWKRKWIALSKDNVYLLPADKRMKNVRTVDG